MISSRECLRSSAHAPSRYSPSHATSIVAGAVAVAAVLAVPDVSGLVVGGASWVTGAPSESLTFRRYEPVAGLQNLSSVNYEEVSP